MVYILHLISSNESPRRPRRPICPVCREVVVLETSKTDEQGKAIHEECYLLKIGVKPIPPLFD